MNHSIIYPITPHYNYILLHTILWIINKEVIIYFSLDEENMYTYTFIN